MIASGDRDPLASLDELIEIFAGATDPAGAQIYLRIAMPWEKFREHGGKIEGYIYGPFCEFSKTLPFRTAFVDKGPGPTPLLDAVIPDPCHWTPLMPFTYQAHLEFEISGARQTVDRSVVVRHFGEIPGSFSLDSRRWVARGVRLTRVTHEDLMAAREQEAVIWLDGASDDVCREASRLGVPLFVGLEANRDARSQLRRLAKWPAVLVAVGTVTPDERRVLRFLNVAKFIREDEELASGQEMANPVRGGADVLICPERRLPEVIEHLAVFRRRTTYVVVRRQPISPTEPLIATARRACDKLQADLAPIGDFAGYFIEPVTTEP